MKLRAVPLLYTLDFRFEAGTSRGIMTKRDTFFLKIYDLENPKIFGLGECAPLEGLSIEPTEGYKVMLDKICDNFNLLDLEVFTWNLPIIIDQIIPKTYPSMQFGFETALQDILNGGQRIIFKNGFSEQQSPIQINGLVWMGQKEDMIAQIQEKLDLGYKTLKLKVGAIDFEKELKVLESIRSRFSVNQIEIRVDANGAFEEKNVFEKLNRLADFQIHSIEQPIKPKQHVLLKQLCETSPVPVALDEELIGVFDYMSKLKLLKNIKPKYIVLKPSMLGGFKACNEWIEIANRFGIKWWITSALESNIGLNAIAQFTAEFKNTLPQGLGTGQLYHNNIDSPLEISNGHLYYQDVSRWNFDNINELVVNHS